jgi:2-hydroxychromene-2-carboxylate isomerase
MRTTEEHIRFLFDPACPWAWRTSLWIREVMNVRPVTVEWQVFSLEYVNQPYQDEEKRVQAEQRRPALHILERVRREAGNDGIDSLYRALGNAVHMQAQSLAEQETLRAALLEAELSPDLLNDPYDITALDAELNAQYEQARSHGAFGVPTLYFNRSNTPYFGPVIDAVPTGEQAGELWDHVVWMAQQSYFYELKRLRG